MDRIEDLVRTSLRERGDDAEPTPHLYRQVQRRIDRRRRQRAWTLAPIGVAVIAAVAVPLVLSNGPQVPTIADLADRPGAASATGAGELVIVDATGTTGRVDLPSGDLVAPLTESGDAGTPRVLVAPERRDDPPIAVVVEAGDLAAGAGSAEPQPGQAPDSSPPPPDVPASVPGELRATAHVDGQRLLVPTDPAPGFRVAAEGGATLAPDGGWLATLVAGDGGGDADGWAVQLTEVPSSADVDVLESLELTLVLPAGSRLESWTGLEDGAGSRLAVRDPDGRILHLPMVTGDDSVPVWDDEQVEVAVDGPVDAYADDHTGGHVTLADGVLTHVRSVDEDRPAAAAVTLDDGELVTGVSTVGGEVRTQADVRELTDGAADVALRAFGTTTVLTTDAGTWWLERGEEGWTTPVRIEHGAVDAAPVGRDLAAVETPGAPEDAPDPGAATPGPTDGPAALTEDLVVAGTTTLEVLAPDGTRTVLVDLPAEGESIIEDVAVRPGATADDLTVAFSTSAEGFTDVRHVTVTDGEVGPIEVVDAPPFAPASAIDADVVLGGLAWLPDGTRLQWLERTRSGEGHGLTSIAWSDTGPGGPDERNDDVRFGLPTLDGTAARLVDAVALDPSTTQLRFVEVGGQNRWWAYDLVIQADFAPSFTGEPEIVDAPEGAMLLAVAGRDDQRRPTAQVVWRDGAVVLERAAGGAVPLAVSADPREAVEIPAGVAELREVPGGHLVLLDGDLTFVTRLGDVTELGPARAVAPVR